MDPEEDMVSAVLNILYERNIISLIVEGGSVLLKSFIDAGTWDEARVISNCSMQIGHGTSAPELLNAIIKDKLHIQDDEIEFYQNVR